MPVALPEIRVDEASAGDAQIILAGVVGRPGTAEAVRQRGAIGTIAVLGEYQRVVAGYKVSAPLTPSLDSGSQS